MLLGSAALKTSGCPTTVFPKPESEIDGARRDFACCSFIRDATITSKGLGESRSLFKELILPSIQLIRSNSDVYAS